MPLNEPTDGIGTAGDGWDGGRSPRRRKAVRYAVPVAVAGIAAATIGLVPAFAGSGSPDLPEISAQDLIAKMAKSDTQQLSGTVRVSTDLGLPSLPGGAGALGGGQAGREKGGDAASPQSKLMELASGEHTLHVAADGPDKQRVSIVDKAAEYSLIHNGGEVWAYDSGSNTAIHSKEGGRAEAGKTHDMPKGLPKALKDATPQDLAKEALKAAGDTTSVTVDGTAKVAGQDAYQLVIKPKQSGSTIGSIRVSVDADNGVPLKFTLTPKSGGAAAIDVGYTDVDFAKPAASTFAFTPPKGAKVVDGDKQRAKAPKGAEGLHPGKDLKDLKGSEGREGREGPQGRRWTEHHRQGLDVDRHDQGRRFRSALRQGRRCRWRRRRLPGQHRRQGDRFLRFRPGLQHPPGQRPDDGQRHGLRRRGRQADPDRRRQRRQVTGGASGQWPRQRSGRGRWATAPPEGLPRLPSGARRLPQPARHLTHHVTQDTTHHVTPCRSRHRSRVTTLGEPMSQPSAGDRVIETRGLTKAYRGGQLAVDGLDLAVPRGSVFGFLGPNGSGKTTTIRMLMGLIEPTAGSARVLGEPMPKAGRRVLPRVGALIEGPALYGFLSGRDNLLRFDAADPAADPRSRAERVGRALERVGLAAAAGKKARAYSLGMKQRLGLAAALLQPRELLVLDEPTNGLDPQGMREIRSLVRELAADGTTVFLSSHLLDEIEQVCTHAAVMARGRLITQGTVADLSATVLDSRGRGRLTVTTPDTHEAVRVLKEHGVTDLQVTGDRVTGELPTGPPERRDPGSHATAPLELADLNAALVHAEVRVRAFGTERASLEDVFVHLTGEGFDVAG